MTAAPISSELRHIPKAHDPAEVEQRIYSWWEESGFFRPSGAGQPFTIIRHALAAGGRSRSPRGERARRAGAARRRACARRSVARRSSSERGTSSGVQGRGSPPSSVGSAPRPTGPGRSTSSRRSGKLPQSEWRLLQHGRICVSLAGLFDPEEVRARLHKQLGSIEASVARLESKLANPDFVTRAPATIVAKDRERLRAETSQLADLWLRLEELD